MSEAITVDAVSKRFRLTAGRPNSLKEAITSRRRRRSGTAADSGFMALQDVSLEVVTGESFGLIGHNGSGKSTLLRVIAGIYPPTSGSISTSGRISALLELGSGFHPELTGRENIFLNGAILGLSRRHMTTLVDDIIEFSGLGRFIDEPVKIYSSGMYVRLGYAVAVHVEPEILLVDEVLAVGDEEFQRRCLEHMYGLRRAGVTIVLVSHSLGSITSLCDRVAWLDHGQLRAIGAADAVARDYLEHVSQLEAAHMAAEGPDGDALDASVHSGSGEIRLYAVSYLDDDWRNLAQLTTGEPTIVRLWYDAAVPVDSMAVSFDILHERGDVVIAQSTDDAWLDIGSVTRGQGYIDVRFGAMPLTPGSYHLSIRFTDVSGMHVYDRIERCAPFIVRAPGPVVYRGLVSVPAEFGKPHVHPLPLLERSLDDRPAVDAEALDDSGAE